MKTFKFTFLSVLLVAFSFTACDNSSEKKVESAQEDVIEAKQDVKEAQQEYAAEWQKFRDDARIRINENNAKIAEYRIRVKNEKPDARDRYDKRIVELETKNHDLEVKLDSYKDDGSNWDSFKREFNRDMDELGSSIANVFRDNDK